MSRKRDPQLHEKYVKRLKEEVSGVSHKDAGWWKQTFNLCREMSHACDAFFARRGIPPPEFNKYEYEDQ